MLFCLMTLQWLRFFLQLDLHLWEEIFKDSQIFSSPYVWIWIFVDTMTRRIRASVEKNVKFETIKDKCNNWNLNHN